MTSPAPRLDRRAALRMITAAAGCLFCAAAAAAEGPAHWSYEGETGPDEWDRLAPENRVCAVGQEQTPIDLARAARADLGPLKLDWPAGKLRAVNNGHTIQVNAIPAASSCCPKARSTWCNSTSIISAPISAIRVR